MADTQKRAKKVAKPASPALNIAHDTPRAPEVPSTGMCHRPLDEEKWPPRHEGIRCHGYHAALPMPQRDAMRHPLPQVTDANQRAFIECLSYTGNVSKASRLAGISRRTIYDWRADKTGDFEKAFLEAMEVYADLVDEEMHVRGVEGWDEPQFGRVTQFTEGVVGYVRKKSDAVLLKLAAGVRPEKYKHKHELTGKDGAPLGQGDLSALSADELAAYRALVAKVQGKEKVE